MCAQKLAHTLLSLSYCKLFVAWFALYSPLGQTSIPCHLPSHWILRPFRVYTQPTKHLFLDCTKEDGGISSCPRNVLKAPFFVKYLVQKKDFDLLFILDRFLFWMLFCTLNSRFSFLVYILVIFLTLFFFYIYIVVYMKISFGHRKAIFFLVEASRRKLKGFFW